MLIPVAAEHLLWKWKAYNVVCGFVQLDEHSIDGSYHVFTWEI